MDVETLQVIPPWEWPEGSAKVIYKTLIDRGRAASERLIAAELAGEFVVVNDELCAALLAIIKDSTESDEIRARAAIALGPALESGYTNEFDDPDEVPISEDMFYEIQDTLREVYQDQSVPKEVRRKILEGSARAPEDWHKQAVREAYADGDPQWTLTAVFASRYVRGFDEQILEALESADEDIHFQAVQAAGDNELSPAWPHVVGLLKDPATPKPLLLAAIEASSYIRPKEAGMVLVDLSDSRDEEIADAAMEAMSMAEAASFEGEDEDDEERWVN